jgi:hypothetical protein
MRDRVVVELNSRFRRSLAAVIAVVAAITLLAGVADAKGASAPKTLNQSTANRVVAIVGRALGAGWGLPSQHIPSDGQAVKYPPPGVFRDAPFVQQHAKMGVFISRADLSAASQADVLNSNVLVVSFPSVKNAREAARRENDRFVASLTRASSFPTAIGAVTYYKLMAQTTGTNGQPSTVSGFQSAWIRVNNFLVYLTTQHVLPSNRTDAATVLQAVTSAVVSYLKTGAQ